MQKSSQFIRSLKILHFALTSSCVLFLGIVQFLISQGGYLFLFQDITFIFLPASLVLAAVAILLSKILFNKKVMLIKNSNTPLNERLNAYQSALIIRYAPLEGAAFLTLILAYLTGDFTFFISSAILITSLLFVHPSLKRLCSEMELSQSEVALLENPDAEINKN